MFGSSSNKVFDKLVEKATSPLQLEIDWNSILQMSDMIRQGDVQPKYAMNTLRKKLTNDNINVLNYSLHCIESLVKNCGTKIHQEVTNREFMDLMKNIAVSKPDPIKTKVLELIQCWAFAFRKNPNYKIVEDYFNVMKLEGLQFPVFKESDSMFDVEQAPEWKDDTNCFRCRTEFSTFNRKHHCRCCGQIFCGNCSSKSSPIPKFGIEKEVRVCDPCFDKLKSNPSSITNQPLLEDDPNALPIEYLSSPLSKQKQVTNIQVKSEEEFEEELQLALALSQSEQEEKDKKRNKFSSNSQQQSSKIIIQQQNDESEAELNKFLARSAAKKAEAAKQQPQQQISGPSPPPSAPFVEQAKLSDDRAQEHNEETNQQMNVFIDEVKKFMEIFITRMKSDQLRGRTITNDTAVQSLFLQLQQLHPKLLAFIKFQEDARGYFESLQDKLTQLKDAREALNALRYENFEKRRREAEERERLKQLQLNSKLADMRQKKHLYFKQQTEQNLQKLQEQERDLKLRLEQQRYLVSLRDHQLVSGLQFPINNQNQMPNPYEQQYINPMYSLMSQVNNPQQPQFQQQLPSFLPTNSMMQPQGPFMNQQQQQPNLYTNNNLNNSMSSTSLNMPPQQQQQQQQPIMNIPPATPKPSNLNNESLQNNQIPYHSIQQQWQPSQQQQPMQSYQMHPSIQLAQQTMSNQMNFNPQQQQQQQYMMTQTPAFKPQNEEVQLISFD